MTIPQVKAREKTATRRGSESWKNLVAGDRLVLIEKGMGLAKGEKQVVLDEVTVTSVRLELLRDMLDEPDACAREGFPEMTVQEFWRFWASGHGYPKSFPEAALPGISCRRIEWEYD